MNYEIRWAQEQDARDLGAIHSSSWKIAYKNIVPDKFLDRITAEQRADYFRDAIKNGKEETAVIEVDEQIVGFTTLGRSRDEDLSTECGEIWGIYLSPSYWRKGIGSILLSWGQEELASRGISKVTLWVLEDNKNARDFYERMGFTFDGTVKIIDLGKTLREIRYEKTL